MPDSDPQLKGKSRWALFRRRSIRIPTWRGWLFLFLLLMAAGVAVGYTVHPFLAPNHPVSGGALVVEGWAPDYALRTAVDDFKSGAYQKLYVTGGPLERGAALVEYKTYAEFGAAVLSKFGLTTNEFSAVPAPLVRQDRTYTSAVALRSWFRKHGTMPKSINVISVGPHARRSWLLFRKAFGKEVKIGITAIPDADYDPKTWWRSSSGVRAVLGELLAYGYERLLFHPAAEPEEKPP
jgi:hypothetical protein